MATRAIIKTEGCKVAIYKHFDGYPEATLPWLKEFNEDFEKHRPGDPSYKVAQLLRSSVREQNKYSLDDSPYTGWGILVNPGEYGAHYVYTLHKDGSVSYR
jgi:hypothetical protein